MQVFAAWTEWAVYPKDFLALLKHLFLGGQTSLTTAATVPPAAAAAAADKSSSSSLLLLADDIDGAPLSGDEKEDEDLDGVPLDGAALLKKALAARGSFTHAPVVQSPPANRRVSRRTAVAVDDDIDGVPLDDEDDDIDGVPLEETRSSGFIPSKWEAIAPDQVEAQAITTSKWDTLDRGSGATRKRSYESSGEEEEDGEGDDSRGSEARGRQRSSYDEEKRAKLREVEVQTIQYQDELEAGERSLREGQTMSSQLEQFRQRLMRKSLAELRGGGAGEGSGDRHGSGYSSVERRRSISPEE